MPAWGITFVVAALALLAATAPAAAQADTRPEAPPAGGIVPRERPFALGLGMGSLSWDGEAPYDDVTVTSLVLERTLARWLRGRGAMAYGGTMLATDEGTVDSRLLSLDLQIVVLPDYGPFRAVGVMPYALGGFGSLVANPSGDGGRDLPTRAQSQVTWGGGVLARLGSRWEARVERIRARLRLADPIDGANQETTTIHTNRWEGRISWVF
jgi:hypothetical protein